MTIGDWVQTIIGIASLLATIILTIAIFKLEQRHQKELEKTEEKRRKHELEEKAHVFMSENNEELEYLPLCVLAATLHRHDKHTRKIYTNFCRCTKELQCEILRQAEIDFILPDDNSWIDEGIDKLIKDIEKHKLGRNYLYDGAKYFHRAYERYKTEPWEELTAVREFDKIALGSGFFGIKKQSLIDYVEEYFLWLYKTNDKILCNPNPYPPFDYAWDMFNLGSAEEKEVCRWLMEAIHSTLIIIHNREQGDKGVNHLMGDARPETFEDKYYETLLWLYYTYIFIEEEKNWVE